MKLRKAELTALAELLEEGAETPETMAQDFVDRLMDLWAERQWHFAVYTIGGYFAVSGPYITERKAQDALTKAAVTDKAWVLSGATAEGWARRLEELDTPPERRKLTAKQEEQATKGFWSKAHAIREGEVPGIVVDGRRGGGVEVVDIRRLEDLMGS